MDKLMLKGVEYRLSTGVCSMCEFYEKPECFLRETSKCIDGSRDDAVKFPELNTGANIRKIWVLANAPAIKDDDYLVSQNWQLAELLGWANIKRTGVTLIGTPPEGSGVVSVRNESVIPSWTFHSYDAMRLLAEHMLFVEAGDLAVSVDFSYSQSSTFVVFSYSQFESKESAIRSAIAHFVINKLKDKKEKVNQK